MDIGIIVYSHTGHTLSVATKLKEKLSAAGHKVTLEQLETVGPLRLNATAAVLKSVPPIDKYEALVLACPVRGGVPAPPMTSYLKEVGPLEGKNVALLVTGFFPVAGWGRNQTLALLKDICESKGAQVLGVGSVGWFSLTRRRRISEAVESLSTLF